MSFVTEPKVEARLISKVDFFCSGICSYVFSLSLSITDDCVE